MSSMDQLIKEINKEFGGTVLHQGTATYEYERIPFTSPRLNYMTFGGLPQTRLIEFYGPDHGGKTTTALDIVANYQQLPNSKGVLIVDAENTLDYVWATKLGVDFTRENIWVLTPNNQSAEVIFEKTLQMIQTDEIGLVLIDSLGVMVSSQALEKSVEDKTYGGISMALTNFSKKAEMLCTKHQCTLIAINQIRDDMNSMYGGTTTTGGRAWRHNCSVRLEFRQGKYFDDKYKELPRTAENPQGIYIQVAMVKNKTCPPTRRTGFYTLRYDIGIDYLYDLTELCIKYDCIVKTGAWFTIVNPETGEQIAKLQGQSAVYNYLENDENAEVCEMLEKYVDERLASE